VEATITSLRKLEWGSMRVNFFVIINPAAMTEVSQSWITAFHLPLAQAGLMNALTRDYPNLTIVDVGGILQQVQAVLDQVITAVEFLFVFTLASGVLVLYAALMGSQDERTREAALLRALGATRAAGAGAADRVFAGGWLVRLAGSHGGGRDGLGAGHLPVQICLELHAFGVAGRLAGGLCAIAGGWLGLRNVLRQPPLQTLREA
jgi:putative ABC transport system permease protein